MLNKLFLFAALSQTCGWIASVSAGGTMSPRVFTEYIDEVRNKDMGELAHKRVLGTYWKATDAQDFSIKNANHIPKNETGWGGECGVAFYFDDMALRLRLMQEKQDPVQTYMKPLAIAPVCSGTVGDRPNDKYPDPNPEGEHRLVFDNYRYKDKNDAYFILTGAANKQDDCLTLQDFAGDQVQYSDDDQIKIAEFWERDSGGVPMDFKAWVGKYTDARDNDKFCIPNPRKHGRGDKIWSDWNWLSTFYGYGQDGIWSNDIKNAFSARKRSRIEGPL